MVKKTNVRAMRLPASVLPVSHPARKDLEQLRKKIGHKYKSKPVMHDGQYFPSQLEKKYYEHVMLLQAAGVVVFFLQQVPFKLPGGVRYRVDYVLFMADGTIRFVDIKGMETTVSKLKIKQVEDLYPVKIEIVKRGDF